MGFLTLKALLCVGAVPTSGEVVDDTWRDDSGLFSAGGTIDDDTSLIVGMVIKIDAT